MDRLSGLVAELATRRLVLVFRSAGRGARGPWPGASGEDRSIPAGARRTKLRVDDRWFTVVEIGFTAVEIDRPDTALTLTAMIRATGMRHPATARAWRALAGSV